MKQQKGWRISCEVGKATKRLENEHGRLARWRRWSASFYNPYIASPTSQLFLQSFRRFTYVTAHYTVLPLLHLRHRHFTYVTAHSSTLPPLYLHQSSFSNPSAASSTPQLIIQSLCRFTYVTGHSTTLPLHHLRHRHFTWRATQCIGDEKSLWWLACYSKLLSLDVATVLDSC